MAPAAANESAVLANLLELYAYDFSEFHDVELGADGRFGYDKLPLYWTEPDRHPFLFRYRGKLAGFALVTKGPDMEDGERVWDMAEFFVLRRYRRRGTGAEATRQILSRLPGRWKIRVMESNKAGREFWARAIEIALGEAIAPVRVEMAGRDWHVFSFEVQPAQ